MTIHRGLVKHLNNNVSGISAIEHRKSKARYRKLFECAPDGIVIADSESRYLDANPSICHMLGYTLDELLGLHASDIVVPEQIPQIDPALSTIKKNSEHHRESRFRC